MASLSVRNVSKSFGAVEVLKGINLEVEAGEFVVLVGPSGCGKSTLLAMIAGLETITAGEIMIGGRVVNNVAPKDRDIAMVFQSYALYPTMTVRQNITFGMESRGVPKAEQDKAVERVSQPPPHRGAAQPQAGPAFRRPAPARRHGPRARARPRALPLRRAALQPRRQAPRRDAHRDQEALPAARQDHRLRDARPGGGDDARLAHRRHAPGAAAAVRRAARGLRAPGQHVRRRLHGLAGDEFPPGRDGRGGRRPGIAIVNGGKPTVLKMAGEQRRAARRRGPAGRASASGRKTSPATIRSGAAAARWVCSRRRSRWSSRPAPRPWSCSASARTR